VTTDPTAKKPWWQMTRTPTFGFVLAGLWLVFALLRWTEVDKGRTVDLVVACVFTLLSAGYLASAVAMVRRERAQRAALRD